MRTVPENTQIQKINTCIIDLDGVIWRREKPMAGAARAIIRLRDAGKTVLFLTNNSDMNRAGIVEKLHGLGIPVETDDVFTSTHLTARYLAQFHRGEKVFVVGSDGLTSELDALGVTRTQSPSEAGVLVAGYARHVDYSVLTAGSGLGTVNHDQTAVAYAHAYNSWLLDRWMGTDDRLGAAAVVAHQVPERAAEEVERMGDEDGIVAIQIPGAGQIPPAGHWSYDPIYRAAADRSLPIVLHTADQTSAVTFPVQHRWAETFTESHAFSFPVEGMWHLISLVCNGTFERIPDLEFVFQEPGFEWLPWMMWRLDDHYLQNSQDLPMLNKMPSQYIRDHCYFTTQPLGHTENNDYMGAIMEMAGAEETLLFASDHPHPDFDPPEEVYRPARTTLEEESLRGIMGETAMDVFGFV